MPLFYAGQKLAEALHALAAGNGTLRERIGSTRTYIGLDHGREIINGEFQDEFDSMFLDLQKLDTLDDEQLPQLADSIVDVALKIARIEGEL